MANDDGFNPRYLELHARFSTLTTEELEEYIKLRVNELNRLSAHLDCAVWEDCDWEEDDTEKMEE